MHFPYCSICLILLSETKTSLVLSYQSTSAPHLQVSGMTVCPVGYRACDTTKLECTSYLTKCPDGTDDDTNLALWIPVGGAVLAASAVTAVGCCYCAKRCYGQRRRVNQVMASGTLQEVQMREGRIFVRQQIIDSTYANTRNDYYGTDVPTSGR